MTGYEIVEHTADVGIRARARSLAELFEQATLGLLEITGALDAAIGEPVAVSATGRDLASVLVAWLEEVLYLQDAKDNVITAVEVGDVSDRTVTGTVWVRPRDESLEGTAVKAVTYHQLAVDHDEDGWSARVFFDI